MTVDKTALKKLIDKTKPADLHVHVFNPLDTSPHKVFIADLQMKLKKCNSVTLIIVNS